MTPKLTVGLLAAVVALVGLAPAAQARPHHMMRHHHHHMMPHHRMMHHRH